MTTKRCEFCNNWANLTSDGQVDCPRCGKYPVQDTETAKPPFTFDVYYGHDGTPVVHVQTEGMPEDEKGPICRIYLNDGEAIYENPPLPGTEEVEDD